MARALLLTGAPGVGKTTLLRKVAAALAGFTTDEMRTGRLRVGFRIVPIGGVERVMAHVDFRSPHRVGRYGVDVAAVDAAAAVLAPDPQVDVYVIDEIGKMECFSQRFVAAMQTLLSSDRSTVVATVARRGGAFIDAVKRRRDVEVWEVTARNRDALVDAILRWIETT